MKNVSMAFRFSEETASQLKSISEHHKRSTTNMVEFLIEEESNRVAVSGDNNNDKSTPIYIKDGKGEEKVLGYIDTDKIGLIFKK